MGICCSSRCERFYAIPIYRDYAHASIPSCGLLLMLLRCIVLYFWVSGMWPGVLLLFIRLYWLEWIRFLRSFFIRVPYRLTHSDANRSCFVVVAVSLMVRSVPAYFCILLELAHPVFPLSLCLSPRFIRMERPRLPANNKPRRSAARVCACACLRVSVQSHTAHIIHRFSICFT